MIEDRCGRAGRLSVQRLVARHGLDAPARRVMEAEIGACPNRASEQIHNRCDPYYRDLSRMFIHASGLI